MQLVLMEWQMGLGAFCSVLLHTVRETSPSHICHLLQKLQRESSLGTDMWQNSVFPCPHPRAMAEREYPPGSAQRDSRTCCCTSRCVYDAGGFLAPSCWRWHPARTILHPSRSLCHWQKNPQDLGFKTSMDSHQLCPGSPFTARWRCPIAQPVL